MTEIAVRFAIGEDLPEVWAMLRQIARSADASASFTLSLEELREAMFGPAPRMRTLVAARVYEVCGIATFCPIYSTWHRGRAIHLEDLFVLPAYRRAGVGSLLIAGLARVAIDGGYTHIRWAVHSWNTQAAEFYDSVGARYTSYTDFYQLAGAELVEAAVAVPSIE
ncbi:GNAT family N-acetyltransferase [Nocardia colli]|uniref:GNAT family N-acetyltransferase n=1 Tax=Nocardia colli TaxID=2545717 RepID=UPI0035D7ED9E